MKAIIYLNGGFKETELRGKGYNNFNNAVEQIILAQIY